MELHSAGRDPGNADHWHALGLDFDRAVEVLNERLNRAFEPPSTLSRLGIPSRVLPSHRVGNLLVGGVYRDRTVVVLHSGEQGLEVAAFYPYLDQGVQVRARLHRVAEFDHGLMALVEADIELADGGVLPLTYFEPLYARDWPHYAALDDTPLSLLISALAYSIEVIEPQMVPMNLQPLREALSRAGVRDLDDAPDDMSLSTAGMSVFVPADNERPDDWTFQGKLVSIEARSVCGEEAWQAKVRIHASEGGDLQLPVLFTRAALHGCLPAVGDDVGGVLWLQGWLWGPA